MGITNRIPRRAALVATALVLASCSSITPTAATDTPLDVVAVDVDASTELAAGVSETDTTVAEATIDNQASHVDDGDLAYDPSDAVAIDLDGSTASSAGDDVAIEGATVTITAGGTYLLRGTLDDGGIIVDAGDDDVTLVLDGVDITHTDGAAIAVMEADEAVILLAEGSTNRLADGASYVFDDPDEDEPNATLFSSADLAIGGAGALEIVAAHNDGIGGKDGLVIAGGEIHVSAIDDGIRGKDYVIVTGGDIVIDAGGDGIKSDNAEDPERGHVLVADGTVTITAGDDGIQAATDVVVTGGVLTIDAGAASGTGRALQGDVMVWITGGDVAAVAADDAIHSNDTVTIDGGSLLLAAGDDGIHGDLSVIVNGGAVTITDAFEGIEAEVIEINDGVIDVTSDDDGLNVASSEAAAVVAEVPAEGRGGRPGGRAPEVVGEHYVYINGGTISITVTGALAEQGDGIDANGHIVMTGGVVTISGATDTRNSALDYSGGTFTMTGGTLVGTNIDGRNSQGIADGSNQPSVELRTGVTVPAGTEVRIESADGRELVTFEPANDFSVVVFSSPDLVVGETYAVVLGGDTVGTATATR